MLPTCSCLNIVHITCLSNSSQLVFSRVGAVWWKSENHGANYYQKWTHWQNRLLKWSRMDVAKTCKQVGFSHLFASTKQTPYKAVWELQFPHLNGMQVVVGVLSNGSCSIQSVGVMEMKHTSQVSPSICHFLLPTMMCPLTVQSIGSTNKPFLTQLQIL